MAAFHRWNNQRKIRDLGPGHALEVQDEANLKMLLTTIDILLIIEFFFLGQHRVLVLLGIKSPAILIMHLCLLVNESL